jgi:hypothetical protein
MVAVVEDVVTVRVLSVRGSEWWKGVENKEDSSEISGRQPDLEQSV